MLNYSIKANLSAQKGTAGEKVTLTAKFNNVEGEIKYVYLSIPRYYIREVLKKVDDNTYTINYIIPWDAPKGQYNLEVYAIDTDWKSGDKSILQFTVN